MFYGSTSSSRPRKSSYGIACQLSAETAPSARVINATNSQQPTEICGSVTGCGAYVTGDATAWQQPRSYELGFRLEF